MIRTVEQNPNEHIILSCAVQNGMNGGQMINVCAIVVSYCSTLVWLCFYLRPSKNSIWFSCLFFIGCDMCEWKALLQCLPNKDTFSLLRPHQFNSFKWKIGNSLLNHFQIPYKVNVTLGKSCSFIPVLKYLIPRFYFFPSSCIVTLGSVPDSPLSN
jgi:hypothetical protein